MLEPCHWSMSSGALWWLAFIGAVIETQCGGSCLLAEREATVVCPHCRQGIGIVVHFCKCESQRGRVLSDFLNWACAHGAYCDLDSTDSHALCLLREWGWVMVWTWLDKGYLVTVVSLILITPFILHLDQEELQSSGLKGMLTCNVFLSSISESESESLCHCTSIYNEISSSNSSGVFIHSYTVCVSGDL